MMTTLKRAISSALALTGYGVYAADSSDGRAKYIDDSGNIWTLSSDGLRDINKLVNGGFDYAQRQTPATLFTISQTASRGYTADRWAVTNENASIQYRRFDTASAPETGLTARFYGQYSKITTTGKITVSQAVEAIDCMSLRGRKVRFQLKMKATAAKVIRLALLQLTAAGTLDVVPGYASSGPSGTFISAHGANTVDPTFGTNLSKVAPDTADNATIANSGLSCSVTTAWQRFGGTFTLPLDFKNLVVVAFTDSQFVAADAFMMSEAGLYDGTEIREWQPVEQILRCQRTYPKSFNLDGSIGQNVGLTGAARGYVSVAAAVAAQPIGIRFPAPLRLSSTALMTQYNPSAANAFVRNTTAGSDATATSSANIGDLGADITFTGNAAWTVAQALAVHWSVENEF